MQTRARPQPLPPAPRPQIPRSERLGLGPEKVRREIQLQARLSHVNIVELKQVGPRPLLVARVCGGLDC